MYYYIIFGSQTDYYMYSYQDLFNNNNAIYMYKNLVSKSTFLNKVYNLHTNYRINKIINLPFKRIWFKKMTPSAKHNHICFIFFAGNKHFFMIKYGYLNFLKKKYPNAKFVLFYQDLVKTMPLINVEYCKKIFDIVLSFDQGDCEKYGLKYYPLVYYIEEANSSSVQLENDVYFVGGAKNRLDTIIKAYEELNKVGLKCDFHIVGASNEEMKYSDKIDYCSPMSYYDNIKNIRKSKAILEIMQNEGRGYTLRYCEAVAFDKILITNNKEVLSSIYYDGNRIIYFNDPKDLKELLKNKINTKCKYENKKELSPNKLIEFLNNEFGDVER